MQKKVPVLKPFSNKAFLLRCKIENHFSGFYSFLMAKRFEADYEGFAFIDIVRMGQFITETEQFVSMIANRISKNSPQMDG